MPNILLDFENLHAGDIVNGQYSADGVTISSANAHTPPMVFDTDNPTGGDHDLATSNLGNVLILSEDGDSNDPDDNAGGGTFVFEFDEPSEVINFRVLDIEEGGEVRLYNEAGHLIKTVHISNTGDNGQGIVNINTDNVARMEVQINGSGAIDEICYCTPEPTPELDGVVEGSAGNDVIDAAYDGDPDGDFIDANDEILAGEGPNDDIVDAFGGNDTITSGEGNDEIYAGSGDDTVNGGNGDDIIYGDSNYAGPGAGGSVRESFEWDLQSEAEVDTTFVQDTGNVEVTYTRLADENHHDSYLNNEQLNVDGIDDGAENIDTDSGLTSITNGSDGRGEFQWEFSTPVSNVEFNINDIDGDGVVNVTAYDANGNEIPVTLTGGSHLTLIDTDGVNGTDTADSNGGYDATDSDNYNLQVEIAGPVARIVVEHTQDGGNNSGVRITDMYYDVNTSVVDNGPDGNDLLQGGAGNDIIYGEGGNDRLEGGAGNDLLEGGDGNDILLGGAGDDVANGGAGNEEIWMGSGNDTVNGGDGNDWVHGQSGNDVLNGDAGDDMLFGEGGDDILNGGTGNDMLTGGTGADTISGGDDRDVIKGGNDGDVVDGGTGSTAANDADDFDTLDLTGEGPFRVVGETEDADGNSTSGTVEFLDGNGNVTGSLQFTEIEQILGDRVNQGPEANDDTATVDEDGSVTIDVLANDTDPENDDLTITSASVPADQGTVEIVGNQVVFTPAPDFNGDATITYTIEDEAGNEDTGEVAVSVTPVNDGPVAEDDTAETDEDTPVTIDVLGNDTDVDGDDLSVTEATSPDGDVTINPDGTITFTPAENFNGETTITYTVSDGNGGTDEGTVTVSVAAVDELTAVDDVAETDEDTQVVIDVVANDENPDGGEPTIISATVPAEQGTVEIVNNELVFTPAENFNGEATITYTIRDEDDLEDTATATVDVAPINDEPDAVNDVAETDEETPVTIDVLGNDTDVDGDDLTITAATVPADQGTVEIVNNELVFTPAENFTGEATISYSIEDGNGGTDVAEVAVTVNNVNDGPVAVDDIVETDEDTPVTFNPADNDTDVDGDDLVVTEASVPAEQGEVTVNPDGTVTFTPAPDFNGPATITYTVSDGNGGTDEGTSTVNVGAVNDGPTANDDAVTTDEDTPVTINAIGNDTDPDNTTDELEITAATVPADQGTVEIVNNELVFTPAENFNGEATITYSISDPEGGTSTAEVAVTVTPVNDDPVAVDDIDTTMEDEPVVVDLIGNDVDADGDPLTIGTVSVPAEQGTVEDNGDGTVTFTPAPDFNGPATITYTVVDGQGGEDEGEATINVGAVNDAPIAVDDADTTEEDTPVEINLLANDSDPDGDPISVISATVPADQGTLGPIVDGVVTFTPAPDFNGEATISYTISDGMGLNASAEHIVTVTAVDDAPVVVDDLAETDEDTPVTIDPLANDSDPDGQPLSIAGTPVAENGTVTVNPDGTIEYTPDENFNGTDTITYTATDPDGNETEGTITVTVAPVNDAPDAVNDTDTTDEDTPITLDVLANDTDVDGDALTVTGATVPADQGTVEIVGNEVVFTPAENFNGLATISYSIEDGNGGTDTAIHEVDVLPVNDAPVAVDDIAQTEEDTAVVIDLIANDTDVDGDDLTIGTVSVPADQGTVVDNGDGTVTFTPAPNYTGPAQITYTVVDGNGGEDMGGATVNVYIEGVNDGPDAIDDAVTTDEDTPITIDALSNDVDLEGDDLTITGATVPADQGTVEVVGNELVFTPAPDFNGEATITYSITDGNGGTDIAEVAVTVTPVNDDPVAVDDNVTTDEDEPVTIDLIANDTDVDGDPLTIGTVSVPAEEGTVVDNGDGTVTFTPAPNFNGPATITYTVLDGQGGEDEGQAVVSVGAVNDGPDAVDDADTTDEDTPITVDLLANDTDDDGDDLTVINATVPADQGSLVDNGDGTVTFTPAPNFNGDATITYEISDGNGGTDIAEHVITVNAVEDAPEAEDDTATTDEDTPVDIAVLDNDSDPDGQPLTVSEATSPDGDVTINPDGTITFTPDENFNGDTTITYTVTDPDGNEDTATVNVTVTPVNDDPVANDDTATTDEDTPVDIPVLGNDTDTDGDDLTVTEATSPDGDVTINPDGTVTFTPAPDFNGETTVTYTVSDGNGGEDTATVTVTVGSVNDGPGAVDDTATTDEDTPVDIAVLGNDTDPENDDLTVTEATSPDGDVAINPDGTITFTPDENFNGDTTITYTISDGNGGEDTATVNVTVTPVNDDPVAEDDAQDTDEDTPVIIDLLGNDSDVDGDTVSIDTIEQPDNGTVTDNGDGTVTYTPDPDFNGIDTFTYTVTDGNGGTDTATVTVNVGSVNDGPDAVDDEASTNNLTPVIIPVLANDTDPENDDLSVTEASVDVGEVTILPDGTLEYTPVPEFGGVATITYTITDGNGGFDTATVTVAVNDGIVEGTAGDDLIDVNYMDDPEGDMVDNGDEFLPGEGPEDDIILAGDGNDTVLAGEGNDEVYGEDGDDTLSGEAGDDYISGGEGDDVLFGGDGDDTLDAGQGADQLFGEDGNDTLLGGPGTDLLDGGAGDDTITGGNNDDEIIGGTGDDVIEGNDGNDDIRGNQGEDIIDGGAGDDTIGGGNDNDTIDGGDGDDTIQAGDGDDTVVGGIGNDDIQGNDGNDDIQGNEGDDNISGGAGDDTIDAGDGNDTVLGGSGDDVIDLGEGDDVVTAAGSGDDTVFGGAGNDTITTNDGNDTVEGGDGDDVINTSGHAPLPDLGYPGLIPADPNPNDDIDFVDGGDGNDTITTGDDNDTIFGGAGNDIIDGGLDQDTIDGGDGDDRIVGGEGSDTIDGGAGDDTIYAGIDPDLGLPDNLDIPDVDGDLVPDNGQDVVNGGDGNDIIFGADDDDVLNGDAGDDFIDGGVDDDTIDGGTGNDTLIGGQGADTITGGDDRDTILVESAEDGIGDVIDGGTGSTAPGDVGDYDILDLTGSGPLRIVGQTTDADGNSTSGTVEFLDGIGGPVIGTLDFSEIEEIVPCFTPGTSIATPRGEVLVEDLQIGDKVITRDNGIQEIRWMGAKRMDGRELQSNPHLQPVRIQKGSLGNGLPERDMLVSPNHRMLVNNDRVSLYFDENEVLVSAKHLVNPSEGVQTIASMGTTYIHFMFDNHEVVLSNGAWTESFQPGDYSLKGVGNAQRNEIFELFPELQGEAGREAYASARLTLKKHEAKLLFK